VFSEGRDAIYTSLKQLVEVGLMDLETYRNEDGLPRKRYVLVDQDTDTPNPGFQDTGNQDTGFQDTENPAGTITDITKTQKNQNSPLPITDIATSEQSSDATHFTSNLQANVTREDILPKDHWKHLRSKLQKVGKAIDQTGSFHSELAQQEWEGFMFSLELVTDHLDYSWAITDLTQNGKWAVNEKVADEYEAGKELLTLLNTARSAS
jgi:hypothetical protein